MRPPSYGHAHVAEKYRCDAERHIAVDNIGQA